MPRTASSPAPRGARLGRLHARGAVLVMAVAVLLPLSNSSFVLGSSSAPGRETLAAPLAAFTAAITSGGTASATAHIAGTVSNAPPVPGAYSTSGFGPIVSAPPSTATSERQYAGTCAVAPASDGRVDVALAVHETFLCVGARLGWLDEAPKPSRGSDAFPSRAHQHAAEAVAVAWCESNLDPASRNPSSSARGLFQVLRQHDALFARYGSSWREGALDPVLSMAVAADLQSWLVQRGHEPWSDWESANALGSEEVEGPVLVGILPAQHSVRNESSHLAAPALPAWASDPAGGVPIQGSCWNVWQGGGW